MQQLSESPSASSIFLPLSRRRRGSVGSITSQVDKESLSQALDHIHTAASRSGTLTVFNEYTAPPSSSAAADNRSIKEDLQGGLSGLYSRIRNTVATPRDPASGIDGFDDTSSLRSSSITTPLSPSPSQQDLRLLQRRPTDGAASARAPPAEKPLPSPATTSNDRKEGVQDGAKQAVGGKKTASSGRPSLGPTGKSAAASVAGPTLAEVNVNATKSLASVHNSIESTETLHTSNDGASNTTLDSRSTQTATEKLRAATGPLRDLPSTADGVVEHTSLNVSDAKKPQRSILDTDQSSSLPSPSAAKPSTNPTLSLDSPEDSGPVVHRDRTALDPEAARLSLAGLKVPQQYDPGLASSVHSSAPSSSMNGADSDDDNQPQAVGRRESFPESKEKSRRGMSVVLSQIKKRVLSKEYWMRDENAKDCFYCGDSFSTFRRKHHCRTCGQIFDDKCTSLVSGVPFGQSGTIRVCKPCEGIIDGYDDSSEVSEEESVPGTAIPTSRPRHGSSGHTDHSPTRSITSVAHDAKNDTVPTMAIPATRRLKDETKRRSAVLEIDAEPRLPRPTSSRSLKSFSGLKTHPSGHKRHHSRTLLSRAMRSTAEELPPFLTQTPEDTTVNKLPAFHSDNVIDPELADYLSDDESSGDEQSSIMSAIAGDSKPSENDKGLLANIFSSGKKSSRRMADKHLSISGRDVDTASLSSAKLSNPRSARKRNFSMSSNAMLRPAPRFRLMATSSAQLSSNLQESMNGSATDLAEQETGRKTMRSSSMKGSNAPAIELNKASIQHVRKLLLQLLEDSNIPSVTTWEKALMPILLRAVEDVNPDVQNGDDMDIRHYVKLKKIPGGRPGDTAYVSGLVFTKNLALKSMARSISLPNILILTFPLEYTRHKQQYMSLDLLMRQEREYLQNLVHRIAALRPHILFCEKNVSGLALEFLTQQRIAVTANVKPSVLEAISRCSQTRIITSIDKLAVKPAQAGRCAAFYVQTYVHGGRKKSCMFLSGCPKELGCTIVLRGSEPEILTKVKRIAEFMVFVVYNLKLETYFLRDEFALIPSYTGAGTIKPDKGRQQTEPAQEKLSIIARSRDATRGATGSLIEPTGAQEPSTDPKPPTLKPTDTEASDEQALPEHAPLPTFWSEDIELYKNKILSSSPFVQYMQPYLLMRAREQESRLKYLRDLLEQSTVDDPEEINNLRKFSLITEDMIHEISKGASKKVKEVLRAVQEAEYDKAVHNYQTQKRQWEAYIGANSKLFDPYTHQNIAVLYSVVCTSTSVPCSGPDTLALGFYNEHETNQDFEADCTLGQYVEDLCLGAGAFCEANGCERKMLEHHRQYVHGTAQLSVTVEPHACRLSGYEDIILMWSACRICSQETQVLPMSDNTWKYSFGKYLELSFWGHDLHPRTALCPHDLHKNFLRYFGFKNLAVRIQHDPVTLLEIIVPRTRITWKVTNDLEFKNEVYRKAEDRINRFMDSIKARVAGIKIDSILPDRTEAGKDEIDRLTKKAEEEHRFLVHKLQEKYMGSKYYEVIPLNRAVRATQEKVAEWDIEFWQFDRDFFPSEKDIRRLATLQLKKIFLDRDDSVTSLTSTDDSNSTAISEGDIAEKVSADTATALSPSTRILSPEKTRDMLSSVVEDDAAIAEGNDGVKTPVPGPATGPVGAAESQDVQHLALVIPVTPTDPDTSNPSTVPSSPPTLQSTQSTQSSWSASRGSSPELERRQSDKLPPPSQIPRRTEGRRSALPTAIKQQRAQSQPPYPRNFEENSNSSDSPILSTQTSELNEQNHEPVRRTDKKLSEKFGLGALRNSVQPSLIPLSIKRRKDTNVTSLARHFEQLSREFEKERIRDRRQQLAANRQSRALPAVSAKPIIEIYRNVHEAVAERGPADEDVELEHTAMGESKATTEALARNTVDKTEGHGFHAEGTPADDTGTTTTDNEGDGRTESDVEGGGSKSEEERSVLDMPEMPEADNILIPGETPLDLKLDLPKHEKTSLMKILTTFWAERSASGWQALDYPLRTLDHVFADSDIIIREDEPSSLIAFALESEDYKAKLQSIHVKSTRTDNLLNKPYVDDLFLSTEEQMRIERSLLQSTGTHLKYQFQEGSAKMLCKVFYAEQFDAVRRKCGVADRIVESLSRCLKWNSKGGKTKSVFLKTLDDRLVLKSLSQVETQAFLRFAPAYFQLMGEALFHELPSVIAKMLGFYQIIIKNPVTGVEFNWFLLVMENLFYDRAPTRIFDLKGSMRNRKIQSTGEQNEVLLDENMVEFIYESPLFTREHSKKLLRASVWNDTLFLSRQNVMDYSLMVAIDEKRKELVVGIIDCIRTYTWDKKLESWMKDRGKNRPTVTSPREYKNRFREAMGRYVLQAPTCWHQFHNTGFRVTNYTAAEQSRAEAAQEGQLNDSQVREEDQGEGEQLGSQLASQP